mmetsp:Transcript_28113/g.76272  ORF Transcript_28113/g.76272 Transcript_28113/m.76272 type:complete len:271 (+) Transcript_28113:219-1031(+)
MASFSSFVARASLLLAASRIAFTNALDIEFDRIECDEKLPAYVSFAEIQMTCDNGANTRCSFGSDVNMKGILFYHNLNQYTFNNTAYASANLKLLSVEYNLFEFFPVDFCGDWVQHYNYTYEGQECPDWDGYYSFNLPYTLPFDDDDVTMWFATGWQGISAIEIRSDQTESSPLLGYCTLYWDTYVTPSNEDGWRTMPSAAQAGVVVGAILAFLCCCCTWATCCRRRTKHVTDIGYYDDDKIDYEKYEDIQEKGDKKKKGQDKVDKSHKR